LPGLIINKAAKKVNRHNKITESTIDISDLFF